ncbi:MAG: cytochrome c-type biogenesis protein [Bacillota bacterium]|jgi:cytochrome c-type biogenesis protein CcmH
MPQKWLAIIVVLMVVMLAGIGPVPAEERLELNAQEQQLYNQMLKTFVAPDFCGKSLEECPAAITVQMREGIAEQIKEGKSKEEIVSYWTGVYGMKILAAPPKEGFFLSAWLLPLLGLLLGGCFLLAQIRGRGRRKKKKSEPLPPGGGERAASADFEEALREEIIKHL